MSEGRNRSMSIHAVLFAALALAGCSADSDSGDMTAMMAGATAAVGGTAGGGAGGVGAGGAAGTTMVGGTSGGTAGAAGASGGVGGGGGTAGGTGGTAGTNGGAGGGMDDAGMDSGEPTTKFSFFVTSYEGMKRLANEAGVTPKDVGFGGDLGGLAGADMICQTLAEAAGGGGKTWRAFLSATKGGEGGGPVHAIERIGTGPWYDANERLVAMDIEGLLNERPDGDPQSADDLPDEYGVPNSSLGDSHDTLTGSNAEGRLPDGADENDTCLDWTSRAGEDSGDQIMCGHSWPRCAMSEQGCDGEMMGGGFPFPFPGGAFGNGSGWISDHPVAGCKPGVNFIQNGPGDMSTQTVGAGGGYGGIYCFALNE
jgi:hypothetical protein